MDCQNLANVMSGMRDMGLSWSHSSRAATEERGWLPLAPSLPEPVQVSLVTAITRKLQEQTSQTEEGRKGGGGRGEGSFEVKRDAFSCEGLAALCLSVHHVDLTLRESGALGLQTHPDLSVALTRAVAHSVDRFSSLQAPLVLRGLVGLGWLHLLNRSSEDALRGRAGE
jgi:hypothetical protein